MYFSDASIQEHKKIINIYHEQHFGLPLNGTSLKQAMGRNRQMEWEGHWKGWLHRQVYRKRTIIKFKHPKNYSSTAEATYITSHYVQEEQILNCKKELAQWSNILTAMPGTQTYSFKPMNSRAITTAVTSLPTSFTIHQITKNLKSNNTWHLNTLPVSYDSHWCLGTVQERQDHTSNVKFTQPRGPHSKFFWPRKSDCCLI
jgi:hypothetical protein